MALAEKLTSTSSCFIPMSDEVQTFYICSFFRQQDRQENIMEPVIVVHGGAWAIPDHLAKASRIGVKLAAKGGYTVRG